MKKKTKLFLLLIFAFLVSGCTAEYNLEIYDGEYKEKVGLFSTGNAMDQETFQARGTWPVPAFIEDASFNNDSPLKAAGIRYYEIDLDQKKKNTQLEYTFKDKDFPQSHAANYCYNQLMTKKDEEKRTISYTTSIGFSCFTYHENLEKIVVNLKTNHKVFDHNADEVKDGKYTWIITKENAGEKYLHFEIAEVATHSLLEIGKKVLIVVGPIAILAGIVIIYYRNRKKRVNKI